MGDVYELAHSALQRPREVILYGRLVSTTLRRLRSYAAPDPTTILHLFCHRSPEANVPTPAPTEGAADDATAGIPAYAVIQAAMLRIFSFKDRDETLEWIAMLWRCIFACPHCYRGYLAGRQLLYTALSNTYPSKNISDLINFVDRSEQAFLLGHLAKASVLELDPDAEAATTHVARKYRPRIDPPPPPLSDALSPTQAYALCQVVGVPGARELRHALSLLLEGDIDRHVLPSTHSDCAPGLVALLLDSNSTLQRWAERCIERLPISAHSPPPNPLAEDPDAWQEGRDTLRWQQVFRPWVEALTQSTTPLETKVQLWRNLTLFLSRAPQPVVRLAIPLFYPVAFQCLSDSTLYFPDVLQCYTLALHTIGPNIWSDSSDDAEYPSVLLSSILDNRQLLPYLEQGGDQDTAWEWSQAHLQSLPPASEQFGTAVKTLAHWSFETMQLPTIPDGLKTRAIEHGVALFLACLDPTTPGPPGRNREAMKAESATVAEALTVYASTLVSVAMHGRLPNIAHRIPLTSSASTSSRQLLSQLLLLDAFKVRDAFLELARILQMHYTKWRSRPKLRTTKDQMDSNGKLVKRAKDIVADAAKVLIREAASQTYPLPQVTRGLWEACYSAVQSPASARAAFALLAPPLCTVAAVMEPTPDVLNFTQRDNDQDPSEFYAYKVAVRRSIRAISQALDDMRGPTHGLLQELATSLSESDLNLLCAEHASQLVQLNLSPEVSTHIGAQNMVRAAFEDVAERIDCFRALLLLSPEATLSGIETFLLSFVDVAGRSMEANKLAEWTIRSLADILDVLTNIRDGLLRPGTPHSFFSESSTKPIIGRHLQQIWDLMTKSLAVIFDRTNLWSQLLNRDALVVWFRDVNLFATDLVEQLKTVQDAGALCQPPIPANKFTLAMVPPLQKAVHWLRLNNSEIMHETLSFVQQALLIFSSDLPLPKEAKNGMLHWVKSQMRIEDPNKRSTLLTIHQLASLKHQIEVGRAPEVVNLGDDEDDDDGVEILSAPSDKTRVERPSSNDTKATTTPARRPTSWWDKAVSTTKAASARDTRSPSSSLSPAPDARSSATRRPALVGKTGSKQQALNFGRGPTTYDKKEKVELDLTRPPPSAPSAGPSVPMGKMQQMRQQFRATHARGSVPSSRPIARPQQGPAWEVPEKAPVATTTAPLLASALGGSKPVGKTAPMDPSDSSSSSSSDDDEEGKHRGIAALRRSAARVKDPAAAGSKIKVLEDEDEARKREQEELERKRRLRAAPDLSLLHKAILSWDLSSGSDTPPLDKAPSRVPKRFASSREYMEVFGPMLQMECWSQLQQSKEQYDERRTVRVEITSRSVVDGFVDVNAVYTAEPNNNNINLSDTDLVFFRSQNNPDHEVLAKVHSYRRHPRGNQVVFRLFLRKQEGVDVRQLNAGIAPRTKWEAGCLFSLSTFHRETVALLVSQYLDLRDAMYSGFVPKVANVPASDLVRAQKKYNLNEPQAQAVLGSLSTSGFSLIQGPPGTGKTKTIVGLVAQFLSTRPKVDTRSAKAPPKAKIMICAPSNAAIDEIVRRLKEGVPDENGQVTHPTVIRLGREDSVNSEVKDVSLDALVERALSTGNTNPEDPTVLREELKQLQQQRQVLQAELDKSQQDGDTAKVNSAQTKLRSVLAKRMTIMSKLDDTRDAQRAQARERDAERRRMRAQVVMGADIVCSTLSGAGQETISALNIDFETVVIDEAAQAVELSTLIPLRYGCKRCILVGDPNQLPPTVISKPAEKAGYSQSLFLRLFKPGNVYLLSIQYRMHPSISKFPSASFYEGRLLDGPDMASKTERVWHGDTATPPFFFFNVLGSEAAGRSHSFINRAEAQVAVALYERLLLFSPKEDFTHRIGVVTTYKAQVDELRQAFAAKYGWDITTTVDFGTVDGFQGQEKDIIILSLVRSSSIGFLADMRRMNVALTRARASLFVLGNADNLRKNKTWGALADAAKSAGLLKNTTADSVRKLPMHRPKPGTKPPAAAARLSVDVAKVNPIDEPQTEDAAGKRMRSDKPKPGDPKPKADEQPVSKKQVTSPTERTKGEGDKPGIAKASSPTDNSKPHASTSNGAVRSEVSALRNTKPTDGPEPKSGIKRGIDPPASKERKSGPSKTIIMEDDDMPAPKKAKPIDASASSPKDSKAPEPPRGPKPELSAASPPNPPGSAGLAGPAESSRPSHPPNGQPPRPPGPPGSGVPPKKVSKASRAALFARRR